MSVRRSGDFLQQITVSRHACHFQDRVRTASLRLPANMHDDID